VLRSKLDVCYTCLYGLSRENLCYILDPASITAKDYPSDNFMFENNEGKESHPTTGGGVKCAVTR